MHQIISQKLLVKTNNALKFVKYNLVHIVNCNYKNYDSVQKSNRDFYANKKILIY